MNAWRLLLSEIVFRPANFALCVLAVAAAATMFMAGPMLVAGHMEDTRAQLQEMQEQTDKTLDELDKKTKRIMRDLGVNLRIVHEDTNFGDLYTDYKAVPFDEDSVQLLAHAKGIATIVHLVATIQEMLTWEDHKILLVGVLPVMTNSQKNAEKPHMVRAVERGTVYVGHERAEGRKVGDTLEINGHEFRIAGIEPPRGALEDIQLVVHLHDAQQVIGQPGKIHQILALNCKCHGNRLSVIRQELEGVLPHTKVTEHLTKATAREQERDLVAKTRAGQLAIVKANRERSEASIQRLIGVLTPLVVLVCVLFVGLLTWLNVGERRAEIGVLRALGKGSGGIAAMFLGKAALLGLVGGIVGCAAGIASARLIGGRAMGLPPDLFAVDPRLVAATVLGAPLVAAMASYLPTLSALVQDPARILGDG